ncbi:hypothetical protein AB205_0112100 [Aquarana catesbeiana]|uniref:Uncharacterized protein n=1 Tax=Aquarana catesbeiana TaxID=8400 RepID=A0A2G9P5I5_AQUCT|nr:hypothetical protein AB205_0112100 [Aquarana catesbeiana]
MSDSCYRLWPVLDSPCLLVTLTFGVLCFSFSASRPDLWFTPYFPVVPACCLLPLLL